MSDSPKLQTRPEKLQGIVGTAVEYAPSQEFGAPSHNVPAQPFLRPAVDLVVGGRPPADVIKELNSGIYDASRSLVVEQSTKDLTYKKAKNIDKAIENSVRKGITATCAKITSQAKQLAPVDTGALKSSIMYKVENSEGGYGVQ